MFFRRYRTNLFTEICQLNGLSMCQTLPLWARILFVCLFPWKILRGSLSGISTLQTQTVTVEGVRRSFQFLGMLANGTPEGRWFRTIRKGDECEVEVTHRAMVRDVITRQSRWSEHTFGAGSKTARLLTHIALECEEVRRKPYDVEEWCDIMILAMDGAWRTGATSEEIENILIAKMEKNKGRVWETEVGPDDPVEHSRK